MDGMKLSRLQILHWLILWVFFLSLYGDSREKSSRSPILTFQTNKRSVQNLESFRPYLRLIATSSSCTSVTSTEEQSDVCDALSPFPLSGKPPFTGTGGILHSLKDSLLSRISTLFLTLLTLNSLRRIQLGQCLHPSWSKTGLTHRPHYRVAV